MAKDAVPMDVLMLSAPGGVPELPVIKKNMLNYGGPPVLSLPVGELCLDL